MFTYLKQHMDKALILNRLKEYKNFTTDTQLAIFLGIERSTLTNWKKRNSIDYDLIFSKCEQMDINIEWLINGKGYMTDRAVHLVNEDRQTTDSHLETQEVPLYDLEATAGLVDLLNSNKPQATLDTIKIPNIPKCDGALTVTGDSMYPLLKSGDIVLYRKTPKDPESIFYGEMYLLGVRIDEFEEMITVKFVQKSDLGLDYIKLVSQNQNHQSKDVHLDKVTAMAMVKVSIRINTMS